MNKNVTIRFFLNGFKLPIRNRNKLKKFLHRIIKTEGKHVCYINYIFCSDEYLLKINSCFLKHNYYTDIITFDLSDSPEIISAEVYISPVRVKENAIQFRTTYSNEIHRVIIHGVLHLCGYADKIKKDILEMRKAEDKYLSLYFK